MDKNSILDQVEVLLTDQLCDFINQGIVTLEELKNTGNLDASIRRAIVDKLSKQKKDNEDAEKKLLKEEDDCWSISYKTGPGCKNYIEKYPKGRYNEKAQKELAYFKQIEQDELDKKTEVLDTIRKNPHSYTPGMIKQYLKDGIINESDLINAGIPGEIFKSLNNIISPQLELGESPKAIPDGYTEVYFWGVPGSGKTCALAGVLSTASKLGYLEIAQGSGNDYMVKLKNIFSNQVSFLPGPSPVDTTQYLPFTLKKKNEKNYRSVSLIELSGEIFECFLYKNGNNPLPSPRHENTLNNLINLLKGENRKIHFFFVDYDKENNVDHNGYKQSDYLEAAATFFNNRSNNLFSTTTDAMYIVLTKSDLMNCDQNNQVNEISQYLNNNNFASFVNSLRSKCEENSINGGRILATPFALGKVYFQQMCIFEDETSRNIIDILMRRIAPQKKSILDLFNK